MGSFGKFRLTQTDQSPSTPNPRQREPATSFQSIFSVSGRKPKGAAPRSVIGDSETPPRVQLQYTDFLAASTSAGAEHDPFLDISSSPSLLDSEPSRELNHDNRENDPMETLASEAPSVSLPSPPTPMLKPMSIPPTQNPALPSDFPYAQSTRSVRERVQRIANTLRDTERLSLGQFIYTVMDPRNTEFEGLQSGFYRSDSSWFSKILLIWWYKLQALFIKWIEPRAIDIVVGMIQEEFRLWRHMFDVTADEITPEFLSEWSLHKIFGKAGGSDEYLQGSEAMPTWYKVLQAATYSDQSDNRANKIRDGELTRTVMTLMAFHARSSHAAAFQHVFSLFAWSSGCSRRMLEVLNRCSMTTSYTSTSNLIKSLAVHSLKRAQAVAKGPHMLGYDNLNVSGSIHVQQRPGGPAKVQSGTFSVIYELEGVSDVRVLELEPILFNLRNSRNNPLTYDELMPTGEQARSFVDQVITTLVRILLSYSHSENTTLLLHACQHQPRRQLPLKQKQVHPIRVGTQEEASIEGNILNHDQIYLEQLGHIPTYAVPVMVDQLTLDRIRSSMMEREGDLGGIYERRLIFQLGIGLFHLIMNFAWCILHKHYLTADQPGSLAAFFTLLNKKRLAGKKPDYYTLMAALQQIRDGLVLDLWNKHGGVELAMHGDIRSGVDELRRTARELYRDSVRALPSTHTPKSVDQPPIDDPIHQNTRMLLRDLLYLFELSSAVEAGDFGRVEDILPDIAAIFRAAGSHKYCSEILHLLYNLKRVWPPAFADVMRDNFVMNVSNLENHWMAIDMNTEHLIGYSKTLFGSRGLYSTWDRLGDISAAIIDLQGVKKKIAKEFSTTYKNSTVKDIDATDMVRQVASYSNEMSLWTRVPSRQTLVKAPKLVPDLLLSGYRTLKTTALKTFSKRMQRFIDTTVGDGVESDDIEDEEDEIEPVTFSFNNDNEDY